ncbi:MAG TPA: ABC transporter ATP-binding protein [Vicinamibacterales bacterium]|nr:ABC transporter ATP-binding protein [Vicinamibacterales bacterium]
MITVQHLTKRFGSHLAVDDLSFEVGAGEVLGFLGPNGAGKTTSMRMVTGYLPPSHGSVSIDGCDLLKRPIDAKRRIGYLPENPPLYPELTIRQFLRFVAEIKDVPRARRAAAVDRAIQRANLGEVAGQRISTLSKGFKQRVGLAQAIVHEPPVLVLDEPTSSLDPKQRVEVRDLIVALRGEHTVLLSTHILPEVSQVTDRVVIINRGRVMAVDSPQNLSQRLRGREEVTVEVGGATATEVREVVAAIAGVTSVRTEEAVAGAVTARIESALGNDVRPDIARALAARWRLQALRSESLSLEEIFLKLTDDSESRVPSPESRIPSLDVARDAPSDSRGANPESREHR